MERREARRAIRERLDIMAHVPAFAPNTGAAPDFASLHPG